MNKLKGLVCIVLFLSIAFRSLACSIFYYVDPKTGNIYIANNEDYWLDVQPYLQVEPKTAKEYGRLWWGWNSFAQGGINEHGLFFDGATTPKQQIPKGYKNPQGRNVGDEILSYCKTVEEAIAFLEKEKIALTDAHIFLGDSTGNAVVIEWINGIRQSIYIQDQFLIATNFLLSDSSASFTCPRYQSIKNRLQTLSLSEDSTHFRTVSNAIAGAVQIPQKDSTGREGGTLYSVFINMTTNEVVIVYKLDNTKMLKVNKRDLMDEKKKQKIYLDTL